MLPAPSCNTDDLLAHLCSQDSDPNTNHFHFMKSLVSTFCPFFYPHNLLCIIHWLFSFFFILIIMNWLYMKLTYLWISFFNVFFSCAQVTPLHNHTYLSCQYEDSMCLWIPIVSIYSGPVNLRPVAWWTNGVLFIRIWTSKLKILLVQHTCIPFLSMPSQWVE